MPTCMQLPLLDHRNPIRQGEGLFLVMGHIDRGYGELFLEFANFRPHLQANLGVEIAQRFVQQQHIRVQDQRSGQGDPLLLSARQLAGIALFESLRD